MENEISQTNIKYLSLNLKLSNKLRHAKMHVAHLPSQVMLSSKAQTYEIGDSSKAIKINYVIGCKNLYTG
jgi:hypothetical protein